jgi:predicted SprT family Zn-dependent metalloprotease
MPQVKQRDNEFQAKSARLFSLWGMPELASHVDIQFSGRLRSSLGRTRVDTRRVRLNPLLEAAGKELLEEVLCHELAHIAVYERFGANVKPHGSEWANLVQQAGYEPRLSAGIDGEKKYSNQLRFEHLCPVCQLVRYAKRPMTSWRCGGCVDAGLEGLLLIRNLGKE